MKWEQIINIIEKSKVFAKQYMRNGTKKLLNMALVLRRIGNQVSKLEQGIKADRILAKIVDGKMVNITQKEYDKLEHKYEGGTFFSTVWLVEENSRG